MAEDRLYRKVSRRIIPLMMVLYLFAFLDRVPHAPARGHRA